MEFKLGRGFSRFLELFYGWPPGPLDPSRETAWLDGVRGVAAFLVVMGHYNMEWLTLFVDAPFGALVQGDKNVDGVYYYYKGDRLWEPWRLPILRVFITSGNAQVAVFFVLSGFVLSWGPLASMRADRTDKLVQSLGSSVIRRWFRLYLPCFAVSLVYLAYGLIAPSRDKPGFWAEIWNFLKVSEQWANPLWVTHSNSWSTVTPYNFVTWTIPFEFSGSIFVYVSMLGLGRIADARRRLATTVAVSLYALVSVQWGYWLFGSGLALADYVRNAGGFEKLSQHTSALSRGMWLIAFTIGLLLMGWPHPPGDDLYTTPGYTWLRYVPVPPGYGGDGEVVIDKGRIWWGLGGILVVTSACHLRAVRKFFELGFNQFLGRISFMLYLIHFFVNNLVSQRLKGILYQAFCTREHSDTFNSELYKSNAFKNIAIYFILWSVSVPMALSTAHFLEVWVDKPCTEFGRWLDDKLVNGFWKVSLIPQAQSVEEEQEGLLPPADLPVLEMGELASKTSIDASPSDFGSTDVDPKD